MVMRLVRCRPWGLLNRPRDLDSIRAELSRFSGRESVTVCELGIDRGHTGSRMVEHLLRSGVREVRYFGIDDLSYRRWEALKSSRHFVRLEFDGMRFIEGDRSSLSSVGPVDFGLVDGCHCAECVHKDAIAMSRRIVPGGTMAFHDCTLLGQYPSTTDDRTWQHYGSGRAIRPIGVVEGISSSRGLWEGGWDLTGSCCDDMIWGGIRFYRKRVCK